MPPGHRAASPPARSGAHRAARRACRARAPSGYRGTVARGRKRRAPAETENLASQKASAVSDSTIRVDVGLLDKLMNLVGELVLARNQILQFNAHQEDTTLNATSQRLNLITTELQEGVMKTRMQPIGVVWNKLPRLVRDLATSSGKQIQLEMDGADTELDKTIIEAIKDPLTHIVRNCCDHGIEKPEVRAAKRQASRRQVDRCAPSTKAARSTSRSATTAPEWICSVVKAKGVRKGAGAVGPGRADDRTGSPRPDLPPRLLDGGRKSPASAGAAWAWTWSRPTSRRSAGRRIWSAGLGEGTTVKLKIPLTLAIIPGLVVKSGGERFVIPQVSLLELIRLEGDSGKSPIEWIHGTPVYRHRDRLLPITYLSRRAGATGGRRIPMPSISWSCRRRTGNSAWWWTAFRIRRKSWSSRSASN